MERVGRDRHSGKVKTKLIMQGGYDAGLPCIMYVNYLSK